MAQAADPAPATDVATNPTVSVDGRPFPAIRTLSLSPLLEAKFKEWQGKTFSVARLDLAAALGDGTQETGVLFAGTSDGDVRLDATLRTLDLLPLVATPEPAAGASSKSGTKVEARVRTMSLEELQARLDRVRVTVYPGAPAPELLLTVQVSGEPAPQPPVRLPIQVNTVSAPSVTAEVHISHPPEATQATVHVGHLASPPEWNVVEATGGVVSATMELTTSVQNDKLDLASTDGCALDAAKTRVTCTATSGESLAALVERLRGVDFVPTADHSLRTIGLKATFAVPSPSGASVPMTYDVGQVVVRPDMPVVPADCFAATLHRTIGKTSWQGLRPVRVIRTQSRLETAEIRGYLTPGRGKCADSFADALGAYAVRVSITASPTADVNALTDCKESDTCAAGSAVRSPPMPIPQDETARRQYAHLNFAHAWKLLYDDEGDKRITEPDGVLPLYANVELWTRDGSNHTVVLPNVAIQALVDLDPVHTMEIVNHPASTSIAVVQCRDILGDTAGESDGSTNAERCVEDPGRLNFSESVNTIPIGIHYRWSPFYERQWLGFGVDASFLALGSSGLFSGNDTSTDGKVGMTAPISIITGIDLAGNLQKDSENTRVGMVLGGGLTMLNAADGTAVRPYFGLSIMLPFASYSASADSNTDTESEANSSATDAADGEGK